MLQRLSHVQRLITSTTSQATEVLYDVRAGDVSAIMLFMGRVPVRVALSEFLTPPGWRARRTAPLAGTSGSGHSGCDLRGRPCLRRIRPAEWRRLGFVVGVCVATLMRFAGSSTSRGAILSLAVIASTSSSCTV